MAASASLQVWGGAGRARDDSEMSMTLIAYYDGRHRGPFVSEMVLIALNRKPMGTRRAVAFRSEKG